MIETYLTRWRRWTLTTALLVRAASSVAAQTPAHPSIRVVTTATADPALSGRLLVFAVPLAADVPVEKVPAVDVNPLQPESGAVAAAEVTDFKTEVSLDPDTAAYPQPFSHLKPGRYAVQAVLDANHSYAYNGRGPGDRLSEVVAVDFPLSLAGLTLTLAKTLPGAQPEDAPDRAAALLKAMDAAARGFLQPVDFESPALGRFWKHPVSIHGYVTLPPNYERSPTEHYPTVYVTRGFSSTLASCASLALAQHRLMLTGAAPPMIYVVLDQSCPTGMHEFADSANNGPWGRALTTELIPELKRRYRLDARASGRFLTGHSSGGWTSLWLQTRYPKVFGGAWATAPDPTDFHDFTGTDLYAPDANVYHHPDGTETPLIRMNGREVASLRAFAQLEAVEGSYGGQLASFDWVFSPPGKGGRPAPMFDRNTGRVDPAVARYWQEHYDLAHLVARDWRTLQPDLDGKIHVVVGDADTFHLDGAAHRFQAVLDGMGAKSEFRFLPGRTHFDLAREGSDPDGLTKRIAWAMYACARPGTTIPAAYR